MKQIKLKLKAPLSKESSNTVKPFIGHGTRLQDRGVENPVRAFDRGARLNRKSCSLLGSDGQRSNAYAKPPQFEPLTFRIARESIWNLGENRARNGMCTLIQKQTQRL